MLQKTAAPEFRQINPAALVFSKSTAQAERRKHFDKEQLKDLIASVTEKGIVQPIVVRTVGDTLEVVAGERRVLAAREAGLDLVPAMVHDLTEEQALDVQLIENLQREDLHPLVEAEGYEQLKKNGHSIDEIAERVGKSKSYIYKRAELLACGPELRAAFYEGTFDASKALAISRLPAKLQVKAMKDIAEEERCYGGTLSFRELNDFLRRNFWLRLDQAPFKTEDANLIPAAGPCGTCPKNTVSQAGLFGDVSKDAALCQDKKCFGEKTAAAVAQTIAKARASGQTVIEGKDAERVLKSGSGFAALNESVIGDSKYRSYKELLGKDAKTVTKVVVNPETGRITELVNRAEANKVLKDKGVKLSSGNSSTSTTTRRDPKEIEKEKAQQAKDEAERVLLTAIAKAAYERPQKPLAGEELRELAELCWDCLHNYNEYESIAGDPIQIGQIPKLDDQGLIRLIRGLLLAEHLVDADKKAINEIAVRQGVNIEKVKAGLAPKAEASPPGPRPGKKSKKKASKKK